MSVTKFGALALVVFSLAASASAQTYDAPEKLESSKKKAEDRPVRVNQALGPMTLLAPAGLLMASFDVNGDYVISEMEFANGQERTFAHIDKDKNNRLTLIEIEGWRENALGSKDASPSAMYFESNFDQVITKTEFNAAFEELFSRADRDDDGVVKFSELIQVRERPARGQRRGGEAGEKGQRRGPPAGGGRGRR